MPELHVLVDIDPNHNSKPLMAKLHALAKTHPIKATLFLCDYQASIASNLLLHPESLEKAIAFNQQQHMERLRALAKEFAHNNITFECETRWHKPYYEAILQVAKKDQCDLIIKGTRPHSFLKTLFVTPSDYQLLKQSEIPLLLSKQEKWTSENTIIAAVDPTHELSQKGHLDDAVIQQAINLSELTGMPFKVCHVFDPSGWEVVLNSSTSAGVMGQFVVVETPEEQQALLKSIKQKHHEKLDALAERHQLKSDQFSLLEGFADEALDKVVKENNAALLIVGTTYRSGLLGSTAEKILESTNCDLLAVKPADFESLDTH